MKPRKPARKVPNKNGSIWIAKAAGANAYGEIQHGPLVRFDAHVERKDEVVAGRLSRRHLVITNGEAEENDLVWLDEDNREDRGAGRPVSSSMDYTLSGLFEVIL